MSQSVALDSGAVLNAKDMGKEAGGVCHEGEVARAICTTSDNKQQTFFTTVKTTEGRFWSRLCKLGKQTACMGAMEDSLVWFARLAVQTWGWSLRHNAPVEQRRPRGDHFGDLGGDELLQSGGEPSGAVSLRGWGPGLGRHFPPPTERHKRWDQNSGLCIVNNGTLCCAWGGLATTEARTTLGSTTKGHAPTVEVRTTPAETRKVWAMPTCTTRRGGVFGPHAHGNVGRQVMDDQDSTWRGGAIRPHARGDMEWTTWTWRRVGSKNRKTTPATTSTTPSAPTTGPR